MIEANNLKKQYGSVAAVDGVSFTVGGGETLGLVGPNGAGKSSLLRILTGLAHADAGYARLNGLDPATPPARRRLGCVPEHPPLFELLTGGEQLLWVGRVHGVNEAMLRDRVDEIASALDLGDALSRRIGGYSKGMRQKLAFAAALIPDPDVLILDEPFEGVDVISVEAMKGMLRQFAGHGAAILLSSHILTLVEDVCSQFAILNGGRVVFQGNRQSLALEAERLTTGAAGRQLESVFLDRVAPRRELRPLKTIAGGRP